MKINLIVLPFEETVKHPPICLGYIGALLRRDENEVRIIDLNLGEEISEADMNIVATATVDYYNCPLLNMDLIDVWLGKIKKLGKPVAILGPHVTTYPDYFLKYGDYLIIGEPEITIKELVVRLNKKESLRGVRGLVYKKGKKVVKNPARPPIANLDILPFPDRSLIRNEKYINPVCKNHPYTMVLSSRGCPYKCTYCYMEVYGHSWRFRSAKNVVEELIEIKKKYGIREIWFRDDLFSFDKERTLEICEGMTKNNLGLTWSCQTRVDHLNREVVKKMKEAGCYVISLGIESGSQEILNNLRKGITLDKAREAVRLCNDEGIRTRGYFIIGCPGETKETINQTFNFAKELDLDYFMLSILTPYPETTLFNEALKEKIIKKKSWSEALKKSGQIKTDFSFEELMKIKRDMYMRYYLRPKYIFNRILKGRFDVLYHGFAPFIRQFTIKKFRGKKF
jgi:radical SAM superfamily enzyme YgiQ (UPF0313 family)